MNLVETRMCFDREEHARITIMRWIGHNQREIVNFSNKVVNRTMMAEKGASKGGITFLSIFILTQGLFKSAN